MKNKLCYIFVYLLICFVFVGNVYAEGVTISTEVNSKDVTKGENRDITIKLTSDEVISSCQFKVESDSNIVFDKITEVGSWKHSGTVTESITVTKPEASTIVPSNVGISQLSYKINGDGKVLIKEIKCISSADSKEYTYGDLVVDFTTIEPADDTTLKSLSVIGGKAIEFKPDRTSYGTSIETSTFGLKFEANNPDYQDDIVVKDIDGKVISDIDNITFSDPSGQGQMLLEIIVNNKTTYSLLVSYIKKELDNSLSFIKINGSDLSLQDGKLEYNLDVDSDVDSVSVEVGLKDSDNFKIGANSNINTETLKGVFSINDTVDINIIVEPKDSSTGATSKTYTIHINKLKGSTTPTTPEKDPTDDKPKEDDNTNITTNPNTSDISMFVMVLILISSLVVSVILYRKNLEGYK